MSTLKKALSYSVVLTTIMLSVGLLATPIAVGAANPGDLVKLHCNAGAGVNDPCKAVYYIGTNGKKFVFINEPTYKTWYANFSAVKEVSQADLDNTPSGGSFVTYRPGVRLIKQVGSPRIYVVAPNGTRRYVSSGDVLAQLYGAEWWRMVDEMNTFVAATYTDGTEVTAATQFDRAAVTAAATSISVDKGLIAGPGPGPVSTGSGLTVFLASDTPGAGQSVTGPIYENAARVPMAKVGLTASSDGDIIVNSLTVANTGAATDSTYSSIDILDGDTMLPFNRTGQTFNSDHQAVFTDDIVVKAGTTRYVILAGNFGSSLDGVASETPRLGIVSASHVDASGATVNGSFPINGTPFNINATTSIGSATVQRGAFFSATDTSIEVGTTGFALLAVRVQNDSNDSDVEFQNLRVYQLGSASFGTDIKNIKLYQDSTEIATGVIVASNTKYIDFHLATPKVIGKGQNIQLVVRGDIMDGSARTIQLAIERSTDLLVKSLRFYQNITPSYTGNGAGSSANPAAYFDPQHTISTGTLTISKTNDVGAEDIAVANDQYIGSFKFDVRGEPVEITQLILTINTTTASATANKQTAVRTIRLIDSTGRSLNTQDITDNTSNVTYTSTMILNPGENVIKILANLGTNAGWATNDNVSVSITPSTGVTARGKTTNNSITAAPGSAITGNTQTIKAANLTVTRNTTPTDKTVISGVSQESLGAWNFDATNSGEDIRITSLSFGASTTANIVNLAVYDGATKLLPVNDTPCSESDGYCTRTVTSTFVFTDPVIIAKKTQKTLTLKGDVLTSSTTGDVVTFGLTDAATTSNSSVVATGSATGNDAAITNTASDGAVITIAAAGTLTIDKDASSLTSKRLAGGTSGIEIATLRLKATSESIKVTRVVVSVAPNPSHNLTAATGTEYGSEKSLSKAWLKLDGVTIGDANGYLLNATSTQIDLAQGVLTIPTGSSGKKLAIVVDTEAIGAPTDNLPGVPNAGVAVGIGEIGGTDIVAKGDSGATATVTYNTGTSSQMIINKSYPEVTKGTASSVPTSGASFYQAKVAAKNDDVAIYRLSFRVTSTTSVIVSNGYLQTASNSCSSCNIGPNKQVSAVTAAGTYIGDGEDLYSFIVDSTQTHGQDHLKVAAGQTAVIDFVASVALSSGTDSVSVSLLGDSASSTDQPTGDPAAEFGGLDNGSFVWSDLWRTISSPLASAQWFNGYLVEGLQATGTPTTLSE